MPPLSVAFDSGPLHGSKTGIGFAVEAMHAHLSRRDDLRVRPYVLSFRAALAADTTRLPLPARAAHLAWARCDHPSVDHWLGDADVVHGTNYVVPPSHLPRIVSVYDCWFFEQPELAGADVRRAGAVLRRAIERGAVVHTSSHATETVVRRMFPGVAVRTVHLGPLEPAPVCSTAPVPELLGTPYVLAIGTIERRKNLPTLVRAFGRLAALHPDVRLVLAGSEGDDTAAVRAAIDKLDGDARRRVLMTGRVDEAVRGWLQQYAAVLAYPSLDEGFGFPLLDAMRAGVPIVASTAGSIPEVAGKAALLCDRHDVTALAEAMSTALTDTHTRSRLIAAGNARWQEFSWQRCADELVDLYRLVAAGRLDDLR